MSRERNDRGQFVGVDDEAVLEAVRDAGRVATARDVAERLDCTREAAYQRLSALHDRGVADRRKVGGRAVVWWVSEGEGETRVRGRQRRWIGSSARSTGRRSIAFANVPGSSASRSTNRSPRPTPTGRTEPSDVACSSIRRF